MNPADGIEDRIGGECPCDEHSHGRGDQDSDKVEVSDAAVESGITAPDATGELERSSDQSDGSGKAVKDDPVSDRTKMYPLRIRSVMKEETFVVVENEECAEGDSEIKQVFRGGKTGGLHVRTFRAMELGFENLGLGGSCDTLQQR